ncbi:MAG TPA: hypothetical protein VF486_25735 [Actinomycetes bacterium]
MASTSGRARDQEAAGGVLTLTGRRNLRATAAALQRHLERE